MGPAAAFIPLIVSTATKGVEMGLQAKAAANQPKPLVQPDQGRAALLQSSGFNPNEFNPFPPQNSMGGGGYFPG